TQVVGALLDNARKHTPAGCDVQVRMLERGDCWRVEVADHGPGLSAEDAAHVFDRFYRADAARARATGGSGLGLAIASGIVAAHQGRIGVESTLGQGCTFWVELPRAAASSGTLEA
ncbi:MAG: two-component sensor histidine kinase, partial [Actinobacteria bacterium]|nr:two-component sensor histidine kinase [Actinomycetota bacterium]